MNTTLQSNLNLFEVTNFSSSAIKSLWFGQAPNGHDMIAVQWKDSDNVYAYTYNGIIETFMFYFNTCKSIGQAMAFSKLRHNFADYYLDNINDGKDLNCNKMIEWCVPISEFGSHSTSITQFNPIDAIEWLSEVGILSRESNPFIDIVKAR